MHIKEVKYTENGQTTSRVVVADKNTPNQQTIRMYIKELLKNPRISNVIVEYNSIRE